MQETVEELSELNTCQNSNLTLSFTLMRNVVNRAYPSFFNGWSFEITLKVPLSVVLKYYVSF